MALTACPECQNKISDAAPACPHCGRPIKANAPKTKSRGTAILIALFLGGIGGHRFYLDRTLSGILYLGLCWTLVPALLAVAEVFRLAFMSDQRFREKYC